MQVYKGLVPGVARDHISLAICQPGRPVTAINDLLQLHFRQPAEDGDALRFQQHRGHRRAVRRRRRRRHASHVADFGQTLGRWG